MSNSTQYSYLQQMFAQYLPRLLATERRVTIYSGVMFEFHCFSTGFPKLWRFEFYTCLTFIKDREERAFHNELTCEQTRLKNPCMVYSYKHETRIDIAIRDLELILKCFDKTDKETVYVFGGCHGYPNGENWNESESHEQGFLMD